ncbi:MAG: GGDEF domain-containing protein, partial [Thermodesulfobacteriota bacterium]
TGRGYVISYVPAWNAVVRFCYFLIISRLLFALRENLAEKTALALKDQLTGLPNGRFFYEILGRELARARRSGLPFTLAYLDLDNFKTVNDTLGHEEGDRVLAAAAAALQKGVRASDTIARLGGDEFAGLFPETGPDNAKILVEKLRGALLSAMRTGGWPVTVSAGAVTFIAFPEKVADMIRQADDLMYEGKKQGRNRALFAVYGETGASPSA